MAIISFDHPLAHTIAPIHAHPDQPYFTEERSRKQPFIDPHLEFVPTTQEHLLTKCAAKDYTHIHDCLTPAYLVNLTPLDLRRIFWLYELNKNLFDLAPRVSGSTLAELQMWAAQPHIAVCLIHNKIHQDCYLAGRPSGAAAIEQPTPPSTTTNRATTPAPSSQPRNPLLTSLIAAACLTLTPPAPARVSSGPAPASHTFTNLPITPLTRGQVGQPCQQSLSRLCRALRRQQSMFSGSIDSSPRFTMAHPGKSTDPNVFILPDLGEGVHEAELIKWRVKVGDAVKEHDVLADMETDKAVVEVPSPRDGTIAQLHGSEGEILHVGNALVTYVGGAASKPTTNGKHDKSETKSSPQPPRNVMEHVPEPEERTEDAGTVVGQMSADTPGLNAAPGKALATPAVRRLAKDMGVDIDAIAGSGIGGRVLEKDVRAAGGPSLRGGSTPAAKQQPAVTKPAAFVEPARSAPVAKPAAPAAPSRAAAPEGRPTDEVTRVPFRGVRRTIANRLRESVNQAVHFTVMDEADVTALDSMRRKLAAASGEKVSFLPFVASAMARVLGQSQFRALNATVDEKPGDANYEASINQHRSVHLGIAADTENGLMVPVIRDADRLGVLELSRAIGNVADAARNRTATREQLMGSTFTISNVGSHAGRFATPIINYPEVAILAVGRGREGMVVNKGSFRVGLLLPLSLACDHRVVDGATAALALAEVIKLLQDPDSLLTPARG